LNLQTRKQ